MVNTRIALLTKAVCLTLVVYVSLSSLIAQSYQPNWTSLDKRPIPPWFDEAKFGIFIHWGLYSVPAWAETKHDPNRKDWKHTIHYAEWYWRLQQGKPGEWEGVPPYPEHHQQVYGDQVKYPDFVNGFTAQYFQPQQWAEVLKASGAKYVILTSKHHDGYALWPSEQAWNWNSVDLKPHRDLVGELTKAVREAGLRMGLYYSLYEWYNPQYLKNVAGYVDQRMLPQMKDIVNRYQPDVLYVDGEWDHPSQVWRSEEFLSWLYNDSPVKDKIAVNDRWGKETRSTHGGYYTSEYGEVNGQQTGESTFKHKWDEIRGIGRSFGYNRMEDMDDYLSAQQIVHMLIEIVSKGGNLTLNIGPTADGRIPVIMQQRLTEIGQWLDINGEAIYGTTPYQNAPTSKDKDKPVFYTKKGNTLYLITTQWPEKPVQLENVAAAKSPTVKMLGVDAPIKSTYSKGKLTIEPPVVTPAKIKGEHAYVFKIDGIN